MIVGDVIISIPIFYQQTVRNMETNEKYNSDPHKPTA
jgi:hypothetical protein